VIAPDWPAPANVRAFVTTRELGELSSEQTRRRLRELVPAEPHWLKQVHGSRVVEAGGEEREADAVLARTARSVCVVQAADCMPVLFTDTAGTVVAAAHAGWRGLAAGVLEATVEAMGLPRNRLIAWLGPAIGPEVYEVGEDVLRAFPGHKSAFKPNRPGHWLLDLYVIARTKLAGLKSVTGGGLCTYSEPERFFSFRRDRTASRMGAFIWLA
jgi:YfiH family protein